MESNRSRLIKKNLLQSFIFYPIAKDLDPSNNVKKDSKYIFLFSLTFAI